MDCLHGVLMHADKQVGDNHKIEDKIKNEEALQDDKNPSKSNGYVKLR